MDEAGWARVEADAHRKRGIVTLERLRACGVSKEAVRWATERRRLVRMFRGVYRLGGMPPGWEQWWLAAKELTGMRTALSHSTAGHLWGLPGFASLNTKRIEVTVSGRTSLELPPTFVIHRPCVPPSTVHLGQHEVTSLARTVMDLASFLDDGALERCLDAAQRRSSVLPLQLERELDLGKPRADTAARVGALLTSRLGRCTDSPLEVDVWRALRQHHVTAPEHQHDARAPDGTFLMRIDFAWPSLRIALHVDSHQWHTGRHEFDRDAAQRTRLSALGWLHFFVTRVTPHEPWLNPLISALRARQPQLRLFDGSC